MKIQNLGTFGLHVIQFPSGKFGYVGSIPSELGFYTEELRQSDWLAGNIREIDGVNKALRFPVFDREIDAVNYAASKGFEVQ